MSLQETNTSPLNFKDVKDVDEAVNKINYLLGLGIIGMGVGNFLLSSTFSLSGWFYTIYFVIFGLMIISAQLKITFVEKHFRFMQSMIGRGLFNIYIGTLCFNFPMLLAWIGFLSLTAVGLFFIYRGVKNPASGQDANNHTTVTIDVSSSNAATVRGI